jgi:hypothetical protein
VAQRVDSHDLVDGGNHDIDPARKVGHQFSGGRWQSNVPST